MKSLFRKKKTSENLDLNTASPAELLERIKEKSAEIQQMKGQEEIYIKQLAESSLQTTKMQEKLFHYEKSCKALEQEQEKSSAQLTTAITEIDELREKLSQKNESDSQDLTIELRQLKEEIREFKNINQNFSNLQIQYKILENEHRNTLEYNNSHKNQLDKTYELLKEKEKENIKLHLQVETLISDMKKYKTLDEKFREIEETNKIKHVKITKLKIKITNLQHQLKNSIEEIYEEKNKTKKLTQKIIQIREKHSDNIKNKELELSNKINNFEEELNEFKNRNNSYRIDENITCKIEKLQEKASKHKIEKDALEEKAKTLSSKLETAKDELIKLSYKLKSRDSSVPPRKHEHNKIRMNSLKSLRKEIEILYKNFIQFMGFYSRDSIVIGISDYSNLENKINRVLMQLDDIIEGSTSLSNSQSLKQVYPYNRNSTVLFKPC